MDDEAERSRAARRAAERALIRVVHHYGGRPEFVVLGGLVPELLCAGSGYQHAGTTDVDVQVDLEIALGAVQTRRLELALRNAEFEPDAEPSGNVIWRWKADGHEQGAVVKFELLADLPDRPAGVEIAFEGCEALGAANLRGTGFAAKDVEVRMLTAKVGGVQHVAEVNVTGLAGFLLAKCAAAHSRRKRKDWYDIAFVLLHNDQGGTDVAIRRVLELFRDDLPILRTPLRELGAAFAGPRGEGPAAYADQMLVDHEGLDGATLRADAVLAVGAFCEALLL